MRDAFLCYLLSSYSSDRLRDGSRPVNVDAERPTVFRSVEPRIIPYERDIAPPPLLDLVCLPIRFAASQYLDG